MEFLFVLSLYFAFVDTVVDLRNWIVCDGNKFLVWIIREDAILCVHNLQYNIPIHHKFTDGLGKCWFNKKNHSLSSLRSVSKKSENSTLCDDQIWPNPGFACVKMLLQQLQQCSNYDYLSIAEAFKVVIYHIIITIISSTDVAFHL